MNELMWHPVVRLPLEKDLRPLLAHLNNLQVLHHVTEEEGQQQLWIADEPRIVEVAELASQWVSGEISLNTGASKVTDASAEQVNKGAFVNVSLKLLNLVPITLLTIFLGFLGAVAVIADKQQLSFAAPFLFQASESGYFISFADTLASGQYWRLLTPVFLHFSWLHIIFNSLIIWEIGRRIEIAKSSTHILLVFVLVGVVSNFAQYSVQANTVFGGLSGVAYGVIGYIGVYQQVHYHPVLQFNKAAIAFFIVWLLLGVFGIIDLFIVGSIANAAHVAGLFSGALLGLVFALIDRANSRSAHL